MIRARALLRILPLPRQLLIDRSSTIPIPAPPSPPPPVSAPPSPPPTIRVLGPRPSGTLSISRRSQLPLRATEGRELRLQSSQSSGIPADHDGPALDGLVRHSCFALQRRASFAAAGVRVALEDGRGHFVGAEKAFFVFVAQVGFVAAWESCVDGSADIFGVVGVVALVVVGVECGESGEDGGFVGGVGPVG